MLVFLILMRCCSLFLGSEKFTPMDVDVVDDVDQCSSLHFASFYHSHKCVDLLLKGENPSLLAFKDASRGSFMESKPSC